MNYSGKKFAVISQSLPPEKSGQAILLGRLLAETPPEQYCLISNANSVQGPDGERLPGKCHEIGDTFRMKLFKIPLISEGLIFLAAFFEIYRRKIAILEILRHEGCDLAIACTGDIANLPATWLACRKLDIPFVVYILDDYIYQWTGLRRLFAWLFEPRFIRVADGVMVLNEFVVDDYAKRYGIRPTLLRNPVDVSLYAKQVEISGSGKIFSIVYTGSVYHAHYDAFSALLAVVDDVFPGQVSVDVYTPQKPEVLAKHGVSGRCLVLHPQVPAESVPSLLAAADALFLPLAFESRIPEVLRSSAPFKMSEYLATGKPILVLAPQDSFLTWFFQSYECGLVAASKNARDIEQALRELIFDKEARIRIGEKARALAESDFDIRSGRRIFFECLHDARIAKFP